ncbi:hypothetical protein AZO1586I_399 [Bathymodiolus thermophilus thioautotrophic gill symbiont]|uniref:Uncharacterized protein n=1 Tax=Bathymodiolus thermophilus thioautotrophic gill symbiont TaxID=2360 RepID=A0ABM8M5R1_9GAMM|nr:hypothetical protein [Bathymodiolus thermophilus thioautotrophic gill symbiont]CAB5498845.1 hypothetical protein AZO1586I_399 [Bathymodiolus thermophilus thioautotrophic gill symbiont]
MDRLGFSGVLKPPLFRQSLFCCSFKVLQRSSVTGQVELDLELDSNNSTQAPEQITTWGLCVFLISIFGLGIIYI